MNHVDNPFDSPVILSLCPGVLGLERGLERAIGPVTVAAYVEIEAFIIDNLVAAMEQGVLAPAPIWSDIKTFRGEWVPNRIHGIIGGYPCQPFSHAGARNGTSDPRHLYPFISGIIQAAGPIWCYFENVEGHLSLGYPEVSADLRSMGYAVEAGIYSAEEVGATHQRDRLFILAIKYEYVAHLQSIGEWRLSKCEQGQKRSEQGDCAYIDRYCEEMGNTEGVTALRLPIGARTEKPMSGKSSTDNSELAHPCKFYVQRNQPEQFNSAIRPEQGERQVKPQSTGDGWPARPGGGQYEWEHPRTITDEEQAKSCMGSAVNGYNFREDLLRAYGNSVVEQTAEIAFIDLLNKHIKS